MTFVEFSINSIRNTAAGRVISQRSQTEMVVGFSAIFFLASFHQALAGKPCTDHRSEYGFALLDHVYHSFTADRLSACYIACNMQPACQSLNYNLADKSCQFNNNTKYFRPKYFVEKATSVYADNPDSGTFFLLLFKNFSKLYNLKKKLFKFLRILSFTFEDSPCY